ncbi:MAG: FkbM family methyltransferase [Polyangiaceae bacterium]|nr:FkbM family methyltransferase [Polyangiaceae bacterium]
MMTNVIHAWLQAGAQLGQEMRGVAEVMSPADAARYVANVAIELPAVVRSRTLSPADRLMGGRALSFHISGTTVRLPGALFSGAREIYGRRVYFALPQFRIRPGDTVVDVGANAGVFTVLAARLARRVIAFEAQSGFCDEIRSNAKLNGCEANVSVEFGIVGESSGFFASPSGLESASHFRGVWPPALKMREILDRHGVDRVDFMKIDIEGSEFGLLRDASAWLPRTNKIAMEVHPAFGDPLEIEALLLRAGFATALLSEKLRPTRSVSERGGYLYAWR